MYCKHCGTKLPEGTTNCPNCTPVVSEAQASFATFEDSVSLIAETPVVEETPTVEVTPVLEPAPKKSAKVWSIFAKVGFGLGLAGLITSIIPYICMVGVEIAGAGLVFSILGRKSNEFAKKAKNGVVLSAIGLGVGFFMCFITGILMALAEYMLYY